MPQWRHNWIPLTAAAARQKNHGHTPGPGSKLAATLKQARKGTPSGVKNTTSTKQPSKPGPSTDLNEAAKAIKAGERARAVNLLTRAMNKATGAQRKAIKAQRDDLARRLMGR